MRKKIGILVAVAMVAAACGAGTPDEAGDQSAAADASATEADHHEGDTDVAEHGHDEDPTDHHEGDTDVAEHGHDEDPAEGPRVVEVMVGEFSFDVPEFNVTRHETVSFVVTNTGRVDHEFRLTTEHAAHEHMEEHVGDHLNHMTDEGSHHEEHFVMVAPGATETLTMTFHDDADFDVAGCLLPGHWEAGLFSPLTIES